MTVYVLGPNNEDLARNLQDSDPAKRAGAARALAAHRDYLALPGLLAAARGDADAEVREAARAAIGTLLPSQEAAARVIITGPHVAPQQLRPEAAAAAIDAFRVYVAAKHAGGGVRSAVDDMHTAVIAYLEAWGRDSVDDLGEVDLAAARAVKSVAVHINALSLDGHGAIKFLSFKAAKERVGEYDAATGRGL